MPLTSCHPRRPTRPSGRAPTIRSTTPRRVCIDARRCTRCTAQRVATCTKRHLLRSTLIGSLAFISHTMTHAGSSRADQEPVAVAETQEEEIGREDRQGEVDSGLPVTVPPSPPSYELTPEEVDRLMQAEEDRRKPRNGRRGRLRELEETRAELAQKQLELLQKEQELLDRDQSLAVLREELELERRIRALLTKEKEQAVEEAALARGLCSGATMLP